MILDIIGSSHAFVDALGSVLTGDIETRAWSKCGRVDVANVERVEATSSRPGQGRHSWSHPTVPRPGAMRPCQQVFENGLAHLLGAGARTSTHTGHIHEGTPCRFPARMPIEAGDRHNRGNTAQ